MFQIFSIELCVFHFTCIKSPLSLWLYPYSYFQGCVIVFFSSSLMSFARVLYILFIFLKNQLFCCLYSNPLISAFIFSVILLVPLGLFDFFSKLELNNLIKMFFLFENDSAFCVCVCVCVCVIS